eukprot:6471979-Amphidinium_carterae.2
MIVSVVIGRVSLLSLALCRHCGVRSLEHLGPFALNHMVLPMEKRVVSTTRNALPVHSIKSS